MSFYAWWSLKQFQAGGSVVYRRESGESVEATMITTTEDHGASWDDIVYLGQVEEFVSSNMVDIFLDEDYEDES